MTIRILAFSYLLLLPPSTLSLRRMSSSNVGDVDDDNDLLLYRTWLFRRRFLFFSNIERSLLCDSVWVGSIPASGCRSFSFGAACLVLRNLVSSYGGWKTANGCPHTQCLTYSTDHQISNPSAMRPPYRLSSISLHTLPYFNELSSNVTDKSTASTLHMSTAVLRLSISVPSQSDNSTLIHLWLGYR